MGIPRLWELLDNSEIYQKRTLAELASIHGYSYTSGTNGLPRYGIDIGTLMNANTTAITGSKQAYAYDPNKPMQNFFYQLCKFLKVAGIFIFVFDGPNRPSWKRGKEHNTTKVPWWTEPCKDLIEACGFYYHQAPGEAEAELAYMNRAGVINAIISPDGDGWPFGAATILRHVPKSDVYRVYSAEKVQDILGLTRGGMIMIALLAGGDYSEGVKGVGIRNAAALAKAGFGDALERAFMEKCGDDLDNFLVTWGRDIFDEMSTNSKGLLPFAQPALANLIKASNFPDRHVLDLYICPLTSFTNTESFSPVPEMNAWVPREPDLKAIATCCSQVTRTWNNRTVLAEKFHNTLWEGTFMRMILSRPVQYDSLTRHLISPQYIASISTVTFKPRPHYVGTWARIEIPTAPFIDALEAQESNKPLADKFCSVRFWIPEGYLPPSIVPFKKDADNTHSGTPSESTAYVLPPLSDSPSPPLMPSLAPKRKRRRSEKHESSPILQASPGSKKKKKVRIE